MPVDLTDVDGLIMRIVAVICRGINNCNIYIFILRAQELTVKKCEYYNEP